jgi:hypothetical protein
MGEAYALPPGAINPFLPIRCDTTRGSIQFEMFADGRKHLSVHEYGRPPMVLTVRPIDYLSNLKVIAVMMAVSHHPNAGNF